MRGPTTGRRTVNDGLERWEAWWSANEPRFVGRGRPQADAITSRSSRVASTFERITPDVVRAEILPTLLTSLADPSPEIDAVAALALARSTPQQDVALMRRALRRRVDDADGSLQRIATLSLGLLGDAASLDDLAALARADAVVNGRRDGIERAYAAAALGLLGDARAVPALTALLADESLANDRGVQQVAVLALGLLRGDETLRAGLLTGYVRDATRPGAARAQAPVALARLAATPVGRSAARSALPLLTAVLLSGKDELALRRAIVIALPRIAAPDDDVVVDALLATAAGASDLALKHLAIVALGEVGGNDRDPAHNGAAHDRIERFLSAAAVDEHDVVRRPFAALGLALWARNPDLPSESRARGMDLLLDGFDGARNPSVRGAFAIALGLVGDAKAAEPLAAAFDATKEPGLVGHLAVAIGLVGDRASAPRLVERVLEKGHDAALAHDLALGLGLLHDPAAVATLVAQMHDADTFAEIACAARGLAVLGDRSAVAPLVAIVHDPKLPDQRRGLALVALGLLAQRDDVAFPTSFRAESNYLEFTPLMAQIASIL
jgi:HEAT repeat protein